jgi:hypothetical protein
MQTFSVLKDLNPDQFRGLFLSSIAISVVLSALPWLSARRPILRFRRRRITLPVGFDALPALYLLGFGVIGMATGSIGIALVGALVPAFLVAYAIHRALPEARPVRGQAWVGESARVTVSIPESGIGRIAGTSGGARRICPARTIDGLPLPLGAQVWVVDVQKGVAVVEAL